MRVCACVCVRVCLRVCVCARVCVCVCVCVSCAPSLSHVLLFAILQTIVFLRPLSVTFFRQEYWSGLLFPPSGDLPNPGIHPTSPASPALQADSLPPSHLGSPLADTLSSNCLVPISMCWTQSQHNKDWTFLLVPKHLQNGYVTKVKIYSNFLECAFPQNLLKTT